MWNIPSRKRLDRLPRLYQTEDVPLKDKPIYLHFFLGDCDWYVAEYDGQDLFFGYAILNGDDCNAEWGHFSFPELKELRLMGWLEVDCELEETWLIRKASEIAKIRL